MNEMILRQSQDFSLDFPYVNGKPDLTADFRTANADFVVDEELGFTPSGEGEHVLLQIRKNGENSHWVAEQIARCASVKTMDVGSCGRKDRHAVTSQWFSVYLPKGAEPNWLNLETENVKVLNVSRHSRKLRKGEHESNRFAIILRECQGSADEWQQRFERIAQSGVPNYFGEQRFGHDGGNLQQAELLLVSGQRIKNRQQRGLYLSAARSYLFNSLLGQRVEQGTWSTLIEGDVEQHGLPTIPLWGRGRSASQAQALALEEQLLQPWHNWCDALERVGLQQERRAAVAVPQDLQWQWLAADTCLIEFRLPPGVFATAVLRELCQLRNAASRANSPVSR